MNVGLSGAARVPLPADEAHFFELALEGAADAGLPDHLGLQVAGVTKCQVRRVTKTPALVTHPGVDIFSATPFDVRLPAARLACDFNLPPP